MSSINIVLITSAEYNLEFFTNKVFYSRKAYVCPDWNSHPDPAYAIYNKNLELDKDIYDRRALMTPDKNEGLLAKIKSYVKNSVLVVPITICCTSSLTFKDKYFTNCTVNKMKTADILIMFYDKTGYTGFHSLIDIYLRYIEEVYKRDDYIKSQKQVCLLIELIKPESEYKTEYHEEVNLGDQIDGFRSLLINDSSLHHLSLEVSTIPADIYSVIKSMIIDLL